MSTADYIYTSNFYGDPLLDTIREIGDIVEKFKKSSKRYSIGSLNAWGRRLRKCLFDQSLVDGLEVARQPDMGEKRNKQGKIARTGRVGRSERFFKEVDVAFLVHELKDPVAIIEAGIRTLLERPEKYGSLSQRQERTLKRSLINCCKARSILNELLEVGRGESGFFITGSFRPMDAVVAALTDALQTFSVDLADLIALIPFSKELKEILIKENIFLTVSSPAAVVEIINDQRKVEQIVGNLIKNALHHRKKRIEIKVDLRTDGFVVEVADDGPGIPSSFQEIIFQRYQQADPCNGLSRNGHGLGLAGARVLARCLGGDITVESTQGKGAIFTFLMPINK